MVLFSSFIIRLFQLIFSAGTVFFSHNISTETVFPCFFLQSELGHPEIESDREKAGTRCPFPVHVLQRIHPEIESRAHHGFWVEPVCRAKFLTEPILCPFQDNFWAVKAYRHHERTREGADGLVDGHGPAARSRQKNCRFA